MSKKTTPRAARATGRSLTDRPVNSDGPLDQPESLLMPIRVSGTNKLGRMRAYPSCSRTARSAGHCPLLLTRATGSAHGRFRLSAPASGSSSRPGTSLARSGAAAGGARVSSRLASRETRRRPHSRSFAPSKASSSRSTMTGKRSRSPTRTARTSSQSRSGRGKSRSKARRRRWSKRRGSSSSRTQPIPWPSATSS